MTTRPGDPKPDHVFVAPSIIRKMVSVVALLAAVATAFALWRGLRDESTDSLVLAGGAATVCVICWVYLAVAVPQRVTITGSVVHIRVGWATQRYDLEDPGVDLLVRDGSVAIGHYRDNWSVVEARDVDWPVFMDVVMRYQNQADHNAEQRDRRFSR